MDRLQASGTINTKKKKNRKKKKRCATESLACERMRWFEFKWLVFSGSPLRGEGRAKGKFETVQLHFPRRAPDNAAPVKALMWHFGARVKSLSAPLHDQRWGCRGLGLDFFFFSTFLQFRVCVTTLLLTSSRSECVIAVLCTEIGRMEAICSA